MFAEGDEEDEDGDGAGDDAPALAVKLKGRKVNRAPLAGSLIISYE